MRKRGMGVFNQRQHGRSEKAGLDKKRNHWRQATLEVEQQHLFALFGRVEMLTFARMTLTAKRPQGSLSTCRGVFWRPCVFAEPLASSLPLIARIVRDTCASTVWL